MIRFLTACAGCLVAFAGYAAESPTAAQTSQQKLQAAVAKVYDTSILHRIEIMIAPEDVGRIIQRTDTRLKCVFSFDGTVLQNVGIRQAGGAYHPYRPIEGKPSFSIKFDEFVEGQELFGLEKLVLKNGLQDLSYLNEHMTYEVFRRAGLAAPMTAHAHVRVNGIDLGLYVMREPVNKQFLTRNFGKDFNDGNLYEIENVRDPMNSPKSVSLKDEEEDGRKRDDLINLAAIAGAAPAQYLLAALQPSFDVDRYVTYLAVEGVTSYYDGFSFHSNNSYLYAHPRDKRFVLIPHGADESFWATGTPVTRMRSPLQTAHSALSRRLMGVPEFSAKLKSEIARVGSAPVWDKPALLERVARFAKLVEGADKTGRLGTDIARFRTYRPVVEGFIRDGGLSKH